VTVISGHTKKRKKEWREKSWSGIYHMVDFVNDRAVYRVSDFVKNNVYNITIFFISARRKK